VPTLAAVERAVIRIAAGLVELVAERLTSAERVGLERAVVGRDRVRALFVLPSDGRARLNRQRARLELHIADRDFGWIISGGRPRGAVVRAGCDQRGQTAEREQKTYGVALYRIHLALSPDWVGLKCEQCDFRLPGREGRL